MASETPFTCEICGCSGFHDLTCHDETPSAELFAMPITPDLLERWRMQCLVAEPVKDATHVEWVIVKDGKIVDPRTISRGLANQLNVKVLAMELSWKRLIIVIDHLLRQDNMILPALPELLPCEGSQSAGGSIPGEAPLPGDAASVEGDPTVELAPLPSPEALVNLLALAGADVPLRMVQSWSQEGCREAIAWFESEMSEKPYLQTPEHIRPFLETSA